MLIVTRRDRFSRDLIDFKIYTERFIEKGGLVITVHEPLDLSASGQLTHNVTMALNEFEVLRVAENTKQVMVNKAKEGKSGGGVVNYGYKTDENNYLIQEPDEAIVVAYIYEKVLQGYSYQDIIDSLEQRNIKTRKGNKFTRSTINDILQNVKYKGVYTYNKDGVSKKSVLKQRLEPVWVESGIKEPIIDPEDFDKVQEIMKLRKGTVIKSDYLLSGVMVCRECGGKMSGSSRYGGKGKERKKYYICPNNLKRNGGTCSNKGIDGSQIENKVIQILTDIVNQFILTDYFDKTYLNKSMEQHVRLRKSIQKTIDKIEERINKDLNTILDPDIRPLHMEALERRIQNDKSSIVELEIKRKVADDAIKSYRNITTSEFKFNDIDITEDSLIAKQLVRVLIDKLIVSDNNIEIEL